MNATLTNDNLIQLQFKYDQAAVQFIRKLDGRRWNPLTKVWTVPLTIGTHNIENLVKLGFSVDPAIFDAIKLDLSLASDLERLDTQPDVPLTTALPLYPFQRTAVAWMSKAGGGVNAYPVGVGKTLMMLGTLEQLKAQNILVIAPKSLLYQWQSEIFKWMMGWDSIVVTGTKEQRSDLYFQYKIKTKPAVLIVSYEIARIDNLRLKDFKWDAIACDEAHRLGSVYTKTRKAIKQLESRSRFALTATPLMNRAEELYGIIDWCFPGALGSYKGFLDKYTLRNQWGGVWKTVNTEELAQRVRRYLIRKELSALAVELPPITIEDIPFELSDKERKLYEQIQKELLFDIEKELISKVESPVLMQMVLVKMLRLMELCDSMELLGDGKESSKLEVLKERLQDVDGKVIVFSRFKRMCNILKRELAEYKPCLITGDVTGEDRAKAIEDFRADDRRVLICSEAGGEGLNLEMANIIFHFDLPYSYGKYVQRNGRIARLTQTKPMMVYNLIAKDSMDEKLARIIEKKQELSDLLLVDIKQMLS